MIRSSRVLRSGLVAAALTLSVGALAGCTGAEPGVAAYVNGTKITDQQVTEAVRGVETTLDPGQTVAKDRIVNTLIAGVIADRVAADNNIVITDADRETLLQQSPLAGLLQVAAARQLVFDAADQSIVVTKLGEEAYVAAAAQQKVTLNPRYGVLDPQQQGVTTGSSGSLSMPLEAPIAEAPLPAPAPTP